MRHIRIAFWGGLVALLGLWLVADPPDWQPAGFMGLRNTMVQASGVLAMGCMSLAMILAVRPHWPERWLGGLDKMYRLHKWLGVGGLVASIVHWLWSKGPKWAVGLGWMERPQRGPQPVLDNPVERFLLGQRGAAEGLGEWAFYAAVLLIAAALIQHIPYSVFRKTHRLLAIVFLVLVFHTVALLKFSYWASPLGIVMAVLLAYGTFAAIVVLFRRVGADRRAGGTITGLRYFPSLRVLEGEIDVPTGWRGHKAGQFAFLAIDEAEGAHPFTIASAWHAMEHRISFVTKELGDYTRRLPEMLRVGQPVTVEGPYGCFTFEDDRPRQIWIGGGIGITPFLARMKELALRRQALPTKTRSQAIDLFHSTADYSEEAIAKLHSDAEAAGVRLHVLHDARDGLLTGDRIRAAVPGWSEASVWFCGPSGFGSALRRDFAAHGLEVGDRFHQEIFTMR